MKAIRATRHLTINNVVVGPADIREIAAILEGASSELQSREKDVSLSFSLTTSDNSEYESESSNIFDEDGVLARRQATNIEMTLWAYPSQTRIVVRIMECGFPSTRSKVSVAGTDSTWINGITHRLENALSDLKKQPTWPRRLRWPVTICVAAAIAYVFYLFGYLVYSGLRLVKPGKDLGALIGEEPFLFIFPLGVIGGIIMIVATEIMDKIVLLWPAVELRTGPEFAQTPRRRRRALGTVFAVFGIPVVLSLITEIIKKAIR